MDEPVRFGCFLASYILVFVLFIAHLFPDLSALSYSHLNKKLGTEKEPLMKDKSKTSHQQLTGDVLVNITYII